MPHMQVYGYKGENITSFLSHHRISKVTNLSITLWIYTGL